MDIIFSSEDGTEHDVVVAITTYSVDIFDVANDIAGALVAFGYSPSSVARIFSDEVDFARSFIPPVKTPLGETCRKCETLPELRDWFSKQLEIAHHSQTADPANYPPLMAQGPGCPVEEQKPKDQADCKTCTYCSPRGNRQAFGACAVCRDFSNHKHQEREMDRDMEYQEG